jgi:PTH1 family peptidyl-tRNA hydrolase
MNLSGQSVVAAMNFYKIPAEKVILLYDDISLEPGKLRIRRKGSDGGHNGLKNIIYLSGKDTFPRVKIGVGAKPHPQYDLAAWVLSHFNKEELAKLQTVFDDCPKIVELMITDQIDLAMNRFNS